MRSAAVAVAGLAAAVILTGCAAGSGNPDDLGSSPTRNRVAMPDRSPTATTSDAEATPTPTPTETADYSAAENRLLNDSWINWTGSPDDLFQVGRAVCRYYNKPARDVQDAIDKTDQLTTGREWTSRLLFVSIATTTCRPATAEKRAAVDREEALVAYVEQIKSKPLGDWISRMEVRRDAVTFCDQGAVGTPYNEIAVPVRRDYFRREDRVRAYIGSAFNIVCPASRVTYTPPPPPPAMTAFGGGTFRVSLTGSGNIQPGTYVAITPGEGCYWERNSATGDIIENYFASGLRVQVTIAAEDYSFHSEGCGRWKRQ